MLKFHETPKTCCTTYFFIWLIRKNGSSLYPKNLNTIFFIAYQANDLIKHIKIKAVKSNDSLFYIMKEGYENGYIKQKNINRFNI
jgi:hypothetical protein